jgi:myosin VIIa
MELAFAEITNIQLKDSDSKTAVGKIFWISTISNEVLKFQSAEAATVYKWLNYLWSQLKKKSTFAVAIQNFTKASTEETYLQLTKGDLVTLEQPGEDLILSKVTWTLGTNDKAKGYFPIDSIYILPCIEPPKKELLALFTKDSSKHRTQPKSIYNTIQRQKMHNLKKFADDHFRPNIE